MAERMTEKELETLRNLQAKQKRVQRHNEEFLKEADERKEELLELWNLNDKLEQAASMYGVDADYLFKWITQEQQIKFFLKAHQQGDTSNP